MIGFLRRKLTAVLSYSAWLWRMRKLVRSPINAIRFLNTETSPDFEGRFRLKGGRFICRKQDWFGVREIFLDNEYSPVLGCLQGSSTPTVVDLGANIGAFALFIFEYFPDAEIVSVEAAPDTYEILRKNQEINPERNWSLFQAAVWSNNGKVSLDRRQASTGHRIMAEVCDGESISARRLDDILEEAGVSEIDLMKIDIEGAESAVVPSNEPIFRKTNTLIIEVHTDRIDPLPVYDVLMRYYSHCWKIRGRNVQKPVFVLTHDDLAIPGAELVSLMEYINTSPEPGNSD